MQQENNNFIEKKLDLSYIFLNVYFYHRFNLKKCYKGDKFPVLLENSQIKTAKFQVDSED
jgi:hypothetical protein